MSLIDFLEPVNRYEISEDEAYKQTQIGQHIDLYDECFPDIEHADVVLVGCGEMRGAGLGSNHLNAADAVRKAFYSLYHWHKEVQVADVGNVRAGATLKDTYAAVETVTKELLQQGRRVVIIGGSHDVTLAQYNAYASQQRIIEATCIDARIDLDGDSVLPADNFLLPMLTTSPNYIRHYNHIGFQSYLVHPHMLETIDKLRFDCYRVGKVKERLEEMEPAIRNSHMVSFDIAALQHAAAPANILTPNGFNGEEACTLMQYAGMSQQVSSIGIYGYQAQLDVHQLTAKQISHMLWYLMDGIYKSKQEARFEETHHFNEFHMAFAEMDTSFLQSKKTGRWWMQMPDGSYAACTYEDYLIACKNDIPERWLRMMERV